MQLGMIGLGRMGANIARRVANGGHECVVYDHDADAVKAMAGEERTTGAFSLAELAEKMATPRVVWAMVPAGDITTSVIEELAKTLESGDIVIDGGNSYYRDDLKHAKLLSEKGIHLLDCGTSGGVWGRERGYCLSPTPSRFLPPSRPEWTRLRAPRAGKARWRKPRRATCTVARPERATSSRWSTTESNTG
jgi:6-phosphogluconate dehydrogenase